MEFKYCHSEFLAPREETVVQTQIRSALISGDIRSCACGVLEIAVYPDKKSQAFRALVFCECRKLRHLVFRGTLNLEKRGLP